MDNSPEGVSTDSLHTLSYDDTVPYEEQRPDPEAGGSLASRIGSTKVYLLSETSTARAGKRKHEGEEEDTADGDEMIDEDPTFRGNAILLHGPPISLLPTTRIFAYATHFDAHPLALEWIDDNTCIIVFSTNAAARTGYRALQKAAMEEPDVEGFTTAKPIPVACWPPEERIKSSLNQGEGLKGLLKMRWARVDDVKKKGARKESNFYKKHGSTAGKELFDGRSDIPPKRRRRDAEDEADERARLDDDLDRFLAQDESEPDAPPSPPSKMRSDYIAPDGRTLLERTTALRLHPELDDRVIAPLPRRRQRHSGHSPAYEPYFDGDDLEGGTHPMDRRGGDRQRGTRGGRRNARQQPRRKTQQELDDELDAFLNEKD